MITNNFKNSEIGPIPNDWEVDVIGESFDIIPNNTLSRDSLNYSDGEYKNVHYGDVLINLPEYTDCQTASLPYINDKCKFNKSLLRNGDIVMADTAEDETAGKVTEIYNSDGLKIVSGLHTIPLRPKKAFAPKFLGYAMNANFYHKQLLSLQSGTKVTSVSKTAIKTTKIAYPKDLPEQRRIAAALSDIDALIDNLDALIDKKRLIKQATMQQLLSGKKRINGFNDKWVEKKLGDCCEIKRGVRVTRESLSANYKYPVFQNTNYPLGYFNKYNVDANTPFVIVGGSAGLIGCCDVNYWAADDCAYFTKFKGLEKSFLYYELILKNKEIKSAVRNSSVPRLDRKEIENLIITLPPTLAEQSAISKILSDMDEEISLLEAKKEKYTHLKQGMMSELLSGRIRI